MSNCESHGICVPVGLTGFWFCAGFSSRSEQQQGPVPLWPGIRWEKGLGASFGEWNNPELCFHSMAPRVCRLQFMTGITVLKVQAPKTRHKQGNKLVRK